MLWNIREWRFSTMESRTMIGWWMLDESPCLGAVLKIKVTPPARNGIPVIL